MRIIIYHKYSEDKRTSIAYTPFHVWEHIFIRIIQTSLYKNSVSVSGMTTSKFTVLIITGEYDKSIECIVSHLKKRSVKKRWIDVETNIIYNELPCMEKLYDVNYVGKYHRITYEQMIDFRKKMYDWDSIIEDRGTDDIRRNIVKPNMKDVLFHEDAMDLKRKKMIESFVKSEVNNSERNEEGFVLFCFPIEQCYGKGAIKHLEEMLITDDTENGFYQVRFKKRFPITIVVWPSLETKDEKIWMIIFTFLNSRYIDFFEKENRDHIHNFLSVRGIITKPMNCCVYHN